MCVGKMPKSVTALKGYPNLEALVDGRVSGRIAEWPMLRRELLVLSYENTLLRALVDQYQLLSGELEEHMKVPQSRA